MYNRQGFTWIELLAGLLLACIIAGVAIPGYVRMKEKAKESEVKSGLHEIQLNVERFAVDTEGSYPPYLIGGTPPLVNQLGWEDDLSDPLLRQGYCHYYPRNPFAKQAAGRTQVRVAQYLLPTSTVYGNDPLRPSTPESVSGLRYGPDASRMGSVLADPRHRTWTYLDKATGKTETRQTYADVEYDYWDMFAPLHHKSFLPGEFFYKGSGPIISEPAGDNSHPPGFTPTQVDSYILGAYGGLRTSGKDVLGSEPAIHFFIDQDGKRKQMDMLSWTRSQVRGPAAREGSPYSEADPAKTMELLIYGNPNGVRDGLVLAVSSGDGGYPGER